jgi:hypothetical protein
LAKTLLGHSNLSHPHRLSLLKIFQQYGATETAPTVQPARQAW